MPLLFDIDATRHIVAELFATSRRRRLSVAFIERAAPGDFARRHYYATPPRAYSDLRAVLRRRAERVTRLPPRGAYDKECAR